MKYIILIFLTAYIFLVFYSKKWNNPFTLTFLFGRKGAGKTTLMAKMMLRDQKKGWTIYTDVKGIKIPGVRVFDLTELNYRSPPPKSSVYLDEVGLTMDNRNYKSFTSGLRDWYALQRHYKCKVTVNSQAFDVDKKVRDRTDSFFYVTKLAGTISIARPIVLKIKPNDMTNPSQDSPICTSYRWGSLLAWKITWLPKYARYFDSFEAPAREDVRWEEVSGISELRRSPSELIAKRRGRFARASHASPGELPSEFGSIGTVDGEQEE